jgi:hypothetical protein
VEEAFGNSAPQPNVLKACAEKPSQVELLSHGFYDGSLWATGLSRNHMVSAPRNPNFRLVRHSTVTQKNLDHEGNWGGALLPHCPTRQAKMLAMFWLLTAVKVATKSKLYAPSRAASVNALDELRVPVATSLVWFPVNRAVTPMVRESRDAAGCEGRQESHEKKQLA